MMKKIFMAIAAALMITTAVNAQEGNNSSEQPKKFDKTEMIQKRTDKMVKEFGLNNEQAKQLLALNTTYADKMGGHKMGRPGGRPGFGHGPQMKDGNFKPDSTMSRKRPELTDEQKTEMKKQRAEMEANRAAYETELQKIMTPDQFKTYQSEQAKRQQGPGPRMDKDNNSKQD